MDIAIDTDSLNDILILIYTCEDLPFVGTLLQNGQIVCPKFYVKRTRPIVLDRPKFMLTCAVFETSELIRFTI